MDIQQVALQLYTLRDFLKDRRACEETFQRVAEIGYGAVEVAAIQCMGPEQIAALAEEYELTICGAHEPPKEILQNPQAVAARAKKLGTSYVAYPFPAGVDFGSRGALRPFIDQLGRSCTVLAEAGITLCYHNHQHEFRLLDGELILEKIFAETGLAAELDTYWVQYGGGDPVAWCSSLEGRLPIVHLKDYRVGEDNQPEFAEVGYGNLDMPAIVEAAEEAGCEWFVVEQDKTDDDPFESVAASFEYIREELCD